MAFSIFGPDRDCEGNARGGVRFRPGGRCGKNRPGYRERDRVKAVVFRVAQVRDAAARGRG